MLKRIWALSVLMMAGLAAPVFAADLGKDAQGLDLEERLAEIESLYIKAGNRKVRLVISGQINKAILFVNEGGSGSDWQRGVVDGAQNPTFIAINGEGKIGPKLKAGFRLELGVNENPAIPLFEDQVSVRHSYVWMESSAGRVSVGRTSVSTDGIVEITTANTDVAAKMLNLEPLSTVLLFGVNLPFDGGRADVVRYDSPSMAGFLVSAAWSSGGSDNDLYDIAIRYAGEFSGFRFAAGAGYRKENHNVGLLPSPLPALSTRDTVFGGSASLMHMGTGLFVNVAASQVKQETALGGTDYRGYHVQSGWQKNVFGVGTSTIYGEYGLLDFAATGSPRPTLVGAGFVQALDGAAMDLYISFRQIDLDDGSPKANAILLGSRIRF